MLLHMYKFDPAQKKVFHKTNEELQNRSSFNDVYSPNSLSFFLFFRCVAKLIIYLDAYVRTDENSGKKKNIFFFLEWYLYFFVFTLQYYFPSFFFRFVPAAWFFCDFTTPFLGGGIHLS